jgi:hypothetical protein
VSPLDESLFCVDVYQNEYLPEGAVEVSAVLTVTCAVDLAQADDVFSCDCRGVGTKWKVAELRKIAAALEARWTSWPIRPGSPPISRR